MIVNRQSIIYPHLPLRLTLINYLIVIGIVAEVSLEERFKGEGNGPTDIRSGKEIHVYEAAQKKAQRRLCEKPSNGWIRLAPLVEQKRWGLGNTEDT